ncbi:hypothetical protein OEZ85_007495 [Tetradesmus obliquus]|uniref:N-acetyltransferase domain-containing protein n=1 Tax=Tetradesmus obliquus TaxID=3088 RepID=A0ABY8TGE4_TETOB|nr:hypothetical protein OEZ85_007495 [Tetradesmus obliquus]
MQQLPVLQRCPLERHCRQRSSRHICQAVQELNSQGQLQFSIRQASSPAELRAAGYLRAHSFYHYPPDRSEYSARMHRRMKGDAEWESVTRKVNGTEPDYKAMRILCLIATVPDEPGCPVAAAVGSDMELSTKLPADAAAGSTAQLVVGSLDINQGAVLPAEELVGRQPQESQAQRRAYLSNICVAAGARRQGIAGALMAEAERVAAGLGVEHMYVHVVHDNAAAQQLYSSMGYEQETEETEGFARALRRPRRLLLHKQLRS